MGGKTPRRRDQAAGPGSARHLDAAFGQPLQLVGNLEVQVRAATVGHLPDLIREIENPSGQVPDRRMIFLAERQRLPPVLGVVHSLGDLGDVVADLVERPLHARQRLDQLRVGHRHAVRVADHVPQRLAAIADTGLFQLGVERGEVRGRNAADDNLGPAAPLDLRLPHELCAAIDRPHGDAVVARQHHRANPFPDLLGNGLPGCVIEPTGHLSQMSYVAISCHLHTTQINPFHPTVQKQP